MERKNSLLVTIATENYLYKAKQLFSSAYWNAGWKGDFMLITESIPKKKLRWFKDKGIIVKRFRTICSKTEYQKLPDKRFNKIILLKFCLHQQSELFCF